MREYTAVVKPVNEASGDIYMGSLLWSNQDCNILEHGWDHTVMARCVCDGSQGVHTPTHDSRVFVVATTAYCLGRLFFCICICSFFISSLRTWCCVILTLSVIA